MLLCYCCATRLCCGADLHMTDSQGMKPVDAAMSRYSGSLGRGGALNVNPETGAYLQSLMTTQ
jgi:hypothetical protein